MDAAGQLAQLAEPERELLARPRRAASRRARDRLARATRPCRATSASVDQALLRAVVQVALQPPALDVAGLDDPGARRAQLVEARLQVRVQTCVLERDRGDRAGGIDQLGLVEQRRVVDAARRLLARRARRASSRAGRRPPGARPADRRRRPTLPYSGSQYRSRQRRVAERRRQCVAQRGRRRRVTQLDESPPTATRARRERSRPARNASGTVAKTHSVTRQNGLASGRLRSGRRRACPRTRASSRRPSVGSRTRRIGGDALSHRHTRIANSENVAASSVARWAVSITSATPAFGDTSRSLHEPLLLGEHQPHGLEQGDRNRERDDQPFEPGPGSGDRAGTRAAGRRRRPSTSRWRGRRASGRATTRPGSGAD